MDAYQRYGPAVRRKCERMLQSAHDAEDITQEIFIELLRRGEGGGEGVALSYLYRAATNRCLNALRDRRRRAALLEQHGQTLLTPPRSELGAQVLSFDLLCKLFERLDQRTQEVVVYRYLDHMQLEEVAEMAGVSRRMVSKRLARARRALEALSAQEGDGR